MDRIPRDRMIGAGCCILSGFACLGGYYLKDQMQYSGIIGWSFSVIFLFGAMYFFSKQTFRE